MCVQLISAQAHRLHYVMLLVFAMKILFASSGFDQDYIITLYQSRNKQLLNASLAVLNFHFNSGISADVGLKLSAQVVINRIGTGRPYPPVE